MAHGEGFGLAAISSPADGADLRNAARLLEHDANLVAGALMSQRSDCGGSTAYA